MMKRIGVMGLETYGSYYILQLFIPEKRGGIMHSPENQSDFFIRNILVPILLIKNLTYVSVFR